MARGLRGSGRDLLSILVNSRLKCQSKSLKYQDRGMSQSESAGRDWHSRAAAGNRESRSNQVPFPFAFFRSEEGGVAAIVMNSSNTSSYDHGSYYHAEHARGGCEPQGAWRAKGPEAGTAAFLLGIPEIPIEGLDEP